MYVAECDSACVQSFTRVAGWGWHPLFGSTNCGRALGNATSSPGSDDGGGGLVWRREFERCSVTLDLGCDVPTRDGCGKIIPK